MGGAELGNHPRAVLKGGGVLGNKKGGDTVTLRSHLVRLTQHVEYRAVQRTNRQRLHLPCLTRNYSYLARYSSHLAIFSILYPDNSQVLDT